VAKFGDSKLMAKFNDLKEWLNLLAKLSDLK
jgi:hypothetical protein